MKFGARTRQAGRRTTVITACIQYRHRPKIGHVLCSSLGVRSQEIISVSTALAELVAEQQGMMVAGSAWQASEQQPLPHGHALKIPGSPSKIVSNRSALPTDRNFPSRSASVRAVCDPGAFPANKPLNIIL